MERSLPVYLSGTPQVGKRARNAKAVEGEHGWLTPVKQSISDGAMWLWQCRCGERVFRRAADVRKVVKRGYVPRCKATCTGGEL